MLDERKEKAITLLLQGEQVINIHKIVGVARSTIYDWLQDTEFKNELDTRRQEIKTRGNNMILNKLDSCVDELLKIALTGRSEKVRSDTAQYLVDRVLGKATTKIEQTTTEPEKKVTKDMLEEVFSESDNGK